jgi:hypothetical protein
MDHNHQDNSLVAQGLAWLTKTLHLLVSFVFHGKLDTEHFLRLVGLTSVIIGLLGAFEIIDFLPAETITLIILGLLGTLILYTIKEKGDILHNNEMQRSLVESLGTVQTSDTEHDVYAGAIDHLANHQIDKIRIFAPVALWKHSDMKLNWVQALGQALEQPSSDQSPRVRELRVIYGLPPEKRMFQEVMVKSLQPLKGKKAAIIRCIMPEFARYAPLPGWGLLIIDDQAVSFAFATHSHQMIIDSAVQITKKDVAKMTIEWFDQAWEETKQWSLQDARHDINMDTRIKEIEAHYDMTEVSKSTTNGTPFLHK